MRQSKRWMALAALVVLAPAVAGCAGSRRGEVTWHDPNMDFSLLQTIAVMPLENLTSQQDAATRVRDVLITMLQATGTMYVLPPGEVSRGLQRAAVKSPVEPSAEEVKALASAVGAEAILTGTVREYGEVRSGSSTANAVSISLQLIEAQSGKVVWSASSTKGGIGMGTRLFGGGGQPMNVVTEEAVRDLLGKLFD